MAKTNGKIDNYTNRLIASVDESSANTLTFAQLPQLTALMEKKAMLFNRIQYNWESELVMADADQVEFGLSLSSAWTTVDYTEPSIIDYNQFRAIASGTPASLQTRTSEKISDFSTLPGGGILVPTRPMYAWVKGTNLGGAVTVNLKIFFTFIDLNESNYWDLVETWLSFS